MVLDAGDLLFKQPVCDRAGRSLGQDVALLLATAYRRMGYDAINLGETDLALGRNFLLGLRKKAGVLFISSNLYGLDRQPVFEPFAIREYSGFRVGLFGLLPSHLPQVPPEFSLHDPFLIAASVVSELKKKADLIICLSNLGLPEDQRLARAVPDIDLIIGGRTNVLLEQPVREGNTIILQAGEKGAYLGAVDVLGTESRDKKRFFWQYVNRILPLDEKVVEDPEIKGMITRFKARYDPLATP